MKKILSCFFLICFVFAHASIERELEEWFEYRLSNGEIGSSSQVFDRALELVACRNDEKAKEFLKMTFPFDDRFIDETISLLVRARDGVEMAHQKEKKEERQYQAMKNILTLGTGFSFTDYVMERREREENALPYSTTEIVVQLTEAVIESLGSGEALILGSPWGAVAAGMAAIRNFQEAAHKYCENVRWEREHQGMYDRTNDSEVR